MYLEYTGGVQKMNRLLHVMRQVSKLCVFPVKYEKYLACFCMQVEMRNNELAFNVAIWRRNMLAHKGMHKVIEFLIIGLKHSH
jgi:hypothetical protein